MIYLEQIKNGLVRIASTWRLRSQGQRLRLNSNRSFFNALNIGFFVSLVNLVVPPAASNETARDF
jgi:hypothetical protein